MAGRTSNAPSAAGERNSGRDVSGDPVEWVEHWWTKQGHADTDRFLAMASLLRVHQLMTDAMTSALKPFDLSVNSYFLILSVQLSGNGQLLLSQLARRIMVHPTTVTLLTDRLESQGLLAREPHPTDRRATFARITPAGRKLVDDATAALSEIDFGVPQLTDSGAKQLITLLRPIRARLGDMDNGD